MVDSGSTARVKAAASEEGESLAGEGVPPSSALGAPASPSGAAGAWAWAGAWAGEGLGGAPPPTVRTEMDQTGGPAAAAAGSSVAMGARVLWCVVLGCGLVLGGSFTPQGGGSEAGIKLCRGPSCLLSVPATCCPVSLSLSLSLFLPFAFAVAVGVVKG